MKELLVDACTHVSIYKIIHICTLTANDAVNMSNVLFCLPEKLSLSCPIPQQQYTCAY